MGEGERAERGWGRWERVREMGELREAGGAERGETAVSSAHYYILRSTREGFHLVARAATGCESCESCDRHGAARGLRAHAVTRR